MKKGFVKNAHRVDPYKNFKFLLKFDGRTVLGISKVSPMKRTTEVVKHRDGGDNTHDFKSPGRTVFEPITLERGVTHDGDFEDWANSVHQYQGDANMNLAGYKRDLTLEFLNERGQVAKRYFLHNCWVSEFVALPELNSNANAIAIESVKLEVEGWLRDVSTKEPKES